MKKPRPKVNEPFLLAKHKTAYWRSRCSTALKKRCLKFEMCFAEYWHAQPMGFFGLADWSVEDFKRMKERATKIGRKFFPKCEKVKKL